MEIARLASLAVSAFHVQEHQVYTINLPKRVVELVAVLAFTKMYQESSAPIVTSSVKIVTG